MAAAAGQAQMCVLQVEISTVMIKLRRDKLYDVGIPSLVLTVTRLTLKTGRIGKSTVKTGLFLNITGDFFMTGKTQRGLRDSIAPVMTVSTTGFELCMGIAQLAGHQ